MLFLGGYLLASVVFLLLAFAGTTADPFGPKPSDGSFDWLGHAKALPAVEADHPPRLFEPRPKNDDPLTYDTRPGGPPPPGQQPPETANAATKPGMSDEERAAAEAKAKALEAQRQNQQKARELIKAGDRQLRSNRYPRAKEIYTKAAKIAPELKDEIAEKFFETGRKNEQAKVWSRAKLLYRMALHFNFENSKYHTALAETSAALGDKRKATEHQRLAAKFQAKGQ